MQTLQAIVVTVAVVGVFLALYLVAKQRRRRALDRVLAPLQMPVRCGLLASEGVAHGQVDGLELVLRYRDTQVPSRNDEPWGPPTARCEVTVRLPCPMPAGLGLYSMNIEQHLITALGGQDIQVGDQRLDEALRIRGDDADAVRTLVLDPEVRGELLVAAGHVESRLSIEGRKLVYLRSGQSAVDPRPVYDLALSLAAALRDASGQRWREFAMDHGLVLSSASSVGDREMAGEIDGIKVRIRLFAQRGQQSARAIVEAGFEPRLPAGMRLLPRQDGGGSADIGEAGALSTGNPVLDTVAVLRCTDPDSARRLLAHDELIAPLMEVLHGHRQPRIVPGGAAVRVEGHAPADIDAALIAVVNVARALAQAMTLGAVQADAADGDGPTAR